MQVENFQLGAFLKEKRTSQHLSSRDLAKRTRRNDSDKEVAASHINKIERGHVHPTFQTLQKIAAALGLPLIIVLDGSQAFPDVVTVVSASDSSRSLARALNREKLMQLLLICQQFTDEQIEAVLTLVRSTSNTTQPKREAEPTET
jgi:transcriptional regulator with XRE-family HTH domain